MDEKLQSQCPACGLQLEVKLAWIGRRGTCKCGEQFYIEPSVALQESTSDPAAPQEASQSIHIVDSEDIFSTDDVSPEESLRHAVRVALADGMVSIDEQILLQNLRHEYGISSESAQQIFEEEKAAIASAASAVDDDELETDEAGEIAATEDETASAASGEGSSMLWVLVGAAAGIGAYLYFSGAFQ